MELKCFKCILHDRSPLTKKVKGVKLLDFQIQIFSSLFSRIFLSLFSHTFFNILFLIVTVIWDGKVYSFFLKHCDVILYFFIVFQVVIFL